MPGLPDHLAGRLRLPAIAAPMLRVSGVRLVAAAARSGIVGAFPTANAGSAETLDRWLAELAGATAGAAPVCPNLIIRQPRLEEHLACLVEHRVEMVITSVGSPAAVVGPLHEVGCVVLADVATMAHAEKALAAGADGLVLLTAGAGGQTGWLNPFAFARAVRREFDGPLVLAGGITDGASLRAAVTLGCDLAYLGTRFIATHESLAGEDYKQMLVGGGMDDIVLTSAFTGLPANIIGESIRRAGLDPARLDEAVTPEEARAMYGPSGDGPRRWTEVLSAGHSIDAVRRVAAVAEVVGEIAAEYDAAPLAG